MHILVTGAAGFIASKVVELLLQDGHTVVGLDNLNDAYDPRLKEYRLATLLGRSGFSFARVDVCDRAALERLWADTADGRPFDAVVNLAARAGVRPSVDDPWVYVDTNMTGTLNLLDLCRRYECPKFVLASPTWTTSPAGPSWASIPSATR